MSSLNSGRIHCLLPIPSLVAACLLFSAPGAQGRVIYVNGSLNTDPVPDGHSWATAFGTVQEGINLAAAGDEVWVVAATYYENINLKNGVSLYGGFAGNETTLGQRNWTNNFSVLDGRQTNSVVIVQPGATNTTRIDGFTIQNGRGIGGGGILCSNASSTISNNRIVSNSSVVSTPPTRVGGGISCYRSTAVIMGNQILSNSATLGQGIYVVDSEVVISGNLISAID